MKSKPFYMNYEPFRPFKPGMFLFLVTQSHITADVLARKVFGQHLDKMGTEDPVAESFETAPGSKKST